MHSMAESHLRHRHTLAQYGYPETRRTGWISTGRTMVAFVRVSSQAYCPGQAGGAADHGGYRWRPPDCDEPLPPPESPPLPDMAHMTPPVVVAKPKQTPPPEQKPRRHLRWSPRPRRGRREAKERLHGSGVDGGGSSACGVSLHRSHPKVMSRCCPEAGE